MVRTVLKRTGDASAAHHREETCSLAGAVLASAAGMFQMDVAQQVRLSYDGIETACDAHAKAAIRLIRVTAWLRLAALAIAGGAAMASAMAIDHGRHWEIGAAIAASAAFAAFAAYVGFNHQPRIYGHRASAARLWLVCEKYRTLLAEMHEGLVDLPATRERRHALLQETAAIFEHTAPDDRETLEIARRALHGAGGYVPPAAAAGSAGG